MSKSGERGTFLPHPHVSVSPSFYAAQQLRKTRTTDGKKGLGSLAPTSRLGQGAGLAAGTRGD